MPPCSRAAVLTRSKPASTSHDCRPQTPGVLKRLHWRLETFHWHAKNSSTLSCSHLPVPPPAIPATPRPCCPAHRRSVTHTHPVLVARRVRARTDLTSLASLASSPPAPDSFFSSATVAMARYKGPRAVPRLKSLASGSSRDTPPLAALARPPPTRSPARVSLRIRPRPLLAPPPSTTSIRLRSMAPMTALSRPSFPSPSAPARSVPSPGFATSAV